MTRRRALLGTKIRRRIEQRIYDSGHLVLASAATGSSIAPLPGDPAIALMLVHDPDRLHEGVANRRAHEAESALLQILAHRLALRRRDGDRRQIERPAPHHLAVGELPDVVVE